MRWRTRAKNDTPAVFCYRRRKLSIGAPIPGFGFRRLKSVHRNSARSSPEADARRGANPVIGAVGRALGHAALAMPDPQKLYQIVSFGNAGRMFRPPEAALTQRALRSWGVRKRSPIFRTSAAVMSGRATHASLSQGRSASDATVRGSWTSGVTQWECEGRQNKCIHLGGNVGRLQKSTVADLTLEPLRQVQGVHAAEYLPLTASDPQVLLSVSARPQHCGIQYQSHRKHLA